MAIYVQNGAFCICNPVLLSKTCERPSSETMKFPLRLDTFKSTMCAVIDKYGGKAFQYGATQGVTELREVLSHRYGVPMERIQITSSSQQGIDVCTRILADPGDVILTSNPSYLGALQSFRSYRADVRGVAHEDDPDRFRAAYEAAIGKALSEGRKIKFLYMIPDFQNPGVANLVTEYGSEISSDRPGEYNAKWGCIEQNEGWKGYPWRSGQVSWCAFDHGSIAGSMMAKLGIIDYFRIPKRYWYWYRNEYAGIAPPEWPTDNAAAKLKLKASGTTAKTDGTDDIQLVVTVCDASGKWVSQSPDVELRIVSGPGEFPTGRSIRFEADSDIRIQDGQAAIAMRSYYAGKTVVEAVSEGLEPARVTIRFEGETEYQEGVTPIAERPYKRYVREGKMEVVQTFGRNNPTITSSNEEEHTPGMAADGNMQTYWKASATDKSPYWTVNTEKLLRLKEIQLHFPEEATRRYVAETSHDNNTWEVLCDKSRNTQAEQNLLLTFPEEAPSGRFVRIRFLESDQAALTEVVVKGIVLE